MKFNFLNFFFDFSAISFTASSTTSSPSRSTTTRRCSASTTSRWTSKPSPTSATRSRSTTSTNFTSLAPSWLLRPSSKRRFRIPPGSSRSWRRSEKREIAGRPRTTEASSPSIGCTSCRQWFCCWFPEWQIQIKALHRERQRLVRWCAISLMSFGGLDG